DAIKGNVEPVFVRLEVSIHLADIGQVVLPAGGDKRTGSRVDDRKDLFQESAVAGGGTVGVAQRSLRSNRLRVDVIERRVEPVFVRFEVSDHLADVRQAVLPRSRNKRTGPRVDDRKDLFQESAVAGGGTVGVAQRSLRSNRLRVDVIE